MNTLDASRSSGAMALLEKYSTINAAIEENRRTNTKIQHEIDDSNQKIHSLQNESKDMAKNIDFSQRETVTLTYNLKEMMKTCDDLSRLKADALEEKVETMRKIELLKRLSNESRRSFLRQCLDFRTTCKRIRLSTSSLSPLPGEVGNLKTCNYYRNENDLLLEQSDSEVDDDGPEETEEIQTVTDVNIQHQCDVASTTSTISASVLIHENLLENNLNSGLPGIKSRQIAYISTKHSKHQNSPDDFEMKDAEDKESEALSNRNDAIKFLEEERSIREAAGRRNLDRATKIEQQRAQLLRVRKDVDEIERKIVELKENTEEVRQIATTYEKGVASRYTTGHNNRNKNKYSTQEKEISPRASHVSHSVTPSPHISLANGSHVSKPQNTMKHPPPKYTRYSTVISNPYKKYKSSSMLTGKSQENRTDFFRHNNEKSNLKQQHPHREGKIRVNRQFSTSIEISAASEVEMYPNDFHIKEYDLNSSSLSRQIESSVPLQKYGDKIDKSEKHPSTLFESSDSDDDDLNFVPFPKKKKRK